MPADVVTLAPVHGRQLLRQRVGDVLVSTVHLVTGEYEVHASHLDDEERFLVVDDALARHVEIVAFLSLQ